MSNDRMTVVPDFLGELDAGVFMNKIAAALNNTALGVLNNGNKGKVTLTFDFERMGNSVEEKRVRIKHKLQYVTPTPRGKATEEDTTETPMWVNKGGKLTQFDRIRDEISLQATVARRMAEIVSPVLDLLAISRGLRRRRRVREGGFG